MRLRGTELVVKLSLLGGALLAVQSSLGAQDVVNQPYTRNSVDRREETVYREEYVTQMQESQQTVLTPVTEYQWEPRIHNRFNILRPRSMAYHLVPRTRWETRSHTVRTPVTYRQLRPETRVVEVPRRELGFSQAPAAGGASLAQNNDASGARVAARHHALPSGAPQSATAPSATISASPQPSAPTVVIPAAPAIGGVLKMDGDHPRFGAVPTNRY